VTANDQTLRARFEADRRDIEAVLHARRPCGKVQSVESGWSDPHDGGQTVALVRFESGLRLLYKPRPVGLEAAFAALVQWWNGATFDLELRAARVLDRGAWGWAEFIDALPCADMAAAQQYFERAGALIALAALLDATDLHAGNVIAHGTHPVLVDLETLLHPRRPGETRSLLDSGLVPGWIRGPDSCLYDVSGFGAVAPQVFGGAPVPLERNVVRVGGGIVSPADFVAPIVAGFRRAAAVVAARRDELLADAGPLHAFAAQPVRVILRHTLTYRAALAAPETLAIQSLLRPVGESGAHAAIARAEVRALAQGDIPRFAATTASADFTPEPGRTLPGFFAGASGEGLCERVREYDGAAVDEEARLLTTALDLWALRGLVEPAAPR
jgi:lantibiotic modifying enzyme